VEDGQPRAQARGLEVDLPPAVDRLDLVDRAAPLPLRDRGGARELAGAGHESNRGELLAVAVGLQPGREAVEAARAVAGRLGRAQPDRADQLAVGVVDRMNLVVFLVAQLVAR